MKCKLQLVFKKKKMRKSKYIHKNGVSVQTPKTRHHRLGAFWAQKLFFTVSEARNLRLGCQHGWVWWDLLSRLQTSIFWLYLYMVGTAKELSGAPLPWWAESHSLRVLPSGPCSLPKALPLCTTTLGDGWFGIYVSEFGGRAQTFSP